MVNGVHGGFGARQDADLGEDIAQVDFDRVRADEELTGDFLVAGASGYQT